MSIEALKQQARRHEQNEEWQKALDQYKKAIHALTQDDQTDIGLINRVGDLYVRVGKLDEAIEHYEQAVDLYREAFLPNNAIAVCKKIIRNVPDRHQAFLKIGQIRAEQGFLPDARTNFLTYAERMQQLGDLDESFRALVEFCDLAPDDVDVRVTVADQMVANDRKEEAIEQLVIAYSRLTQSGERDAAQGIEQKIKEIDPSVDVGAAAASVGLGGMGDDELGGFGDIELGGATRDLVEQESEPDEEGEFVGSGAFEISSDEPGGASASLEEASEEEAAELPMMGFGDDEGDEDEEEAAELPMMGFGGDEDEEEEEAAELPMMGFGGDEDEDEEEEAAELPMMGFGGDEEDEEEEEAAELPTMGFGDEDEDEEEEAAELPTMGFGADEDGEEDETSELPTIGFDEQTSEAQAGADVEDAMEEAAGSEEEPADVPGSPEAEPASPAAESPGGDYVDLGAMIFGGGGSEQKSTRFKVAYEEPSGDEEADFAKMLSQFKEKVSENLDSGDVRAHYDLGTAYKEMGLLEEAISSFQQALRASADHLPTYEQMGQTFLEMGQPEAAVRTLERALKTRSTVEDEFLGIYYYLARAFEALDNKPSALEYYDRVFALDINFADVTERLRELR